MNPSSNSSSNTSNNTRTKSVWPFPTPQNPLTPNPKAKKEHKDYPDDMGDALL